MTRTEYEALLRRDFASFAERCFHELNPHARFAPGWHIALIAAKRIQIDVSPQKLAELEELMRLCGISTKKDLINNALTLLQWAVRQVRNGRTIASIDEKEGRYRELEMPILSTADGRREESRRAAP